MSSLTPKTILSVKETRLKVRMAGRVKQGIELLPLSLHMGLIEAVGFWADQWTCLWDILKWVHSSVCTP